MLSVVHNLRAALYPLGLFGLLLALWPHSAFAGADTCETLNPGACIDGAVYRMFTGVAALIWEANRILLILSYQLDHLRWWLSNQAFLVAYGALRSIAEPLLQPAAMLAITIGLVIFLIVPLFGKLTLINIRQALIWIIIAPLLLSEAGMWLLDLERLRSDVGGVITQQISATSAQGIFGATGVDGADPIGEPVALYPALDGASPCASGTITRPAFAGTAPIAEGIRMDDLAAALLLADAQDIHCPGERAPGTTLPDRFYGPFAAEGNIEDMDPTARADEILKIQRGITRLTLGIVTSLLAVVETLIQLSFTLSLVIIWLALPFVALLILFSDTLRPLGLLIQRIISVLITAWIVSAMSALMSVLLLGAALTGSAPALIALTCGALFILVRLLLLALATISDTLSGVASLAGGITGSALIGAGTALSILGQRGIQRMGRSAADGLDTANEVARATLKAGAVASMAAHATGSGHYALGTALGSIRPIAQVGTVAASMGVIREETAAGLHVGERSARSGIAIAARQIERDAKRTLSDGQTIRQRARQRSIDRQMKQLERAHPVLDYLAVGEPVDALQAAQDRLVGGIQNTRNATARDLLPVGDGVLSVAPGDRAMHQSAVSSISFSEGGSSVAPASSVPADVSRSRPIAAPSAAVGNRMRQRRDAATGTSAQAAVLSPSTISAGPPRLAADRPIPLPASVRADLASDVAAAHIQAHMLAERHDSPDRDAKAGVDAPRVASPPQPIAAATAEHAETSALERGVPSIIAPTTRRRRRS